MLLFDRARLSMQKDGWQDDQGRVFIHYTIKSLAATIHMSEMTVKNALKALEQQGHIYRHRQGVGLPSRIYEKLQTPIWGASSAFYGSKFDINLTQKGAYIREKQGPIRKNQKCHKFKYKQKVPKTTEKPVILGTYWQGH